MGIVRWSAIEKANMLRTLMPGPISATFCMRSFSVPCEALQRAMTRARFEKHVVEREIVLRMPKGLNKDLVRINV